MTVHDMHRTAGRGAQLQLRQPRLAEMVASILRDRILSGELPDGESLPKQEDLLAEFNVSKPSIREALRILETEGLITVRRGSVGGAVVHAPHADDTAYMFGLVLQSNRVTLADVGVALRNLEPACSALCAERHDRDVVVHQIQAVHAAGVEAVGDELGFVREARRFHEVIVSLCGNETMKAIVGALESLWSAKESAWAQSATEAGRYPGPEMRRSGLDAHARILAKIEQGDAEGASRAAYRHLRATQSYALSELGAEPVDATVLRRHGTARHS